MSDDIPHLAGMLKEPHPTLIKSDYFGLKSHHTLRSGADAGPRIADGYLKRLETILVDYHFGHLMAFLRSLLLITPTLALQYTFPSDLGGKTEFSERGWKTLLGQLSSEVKLGLPPAREVSIVAEPTCLAYIEKCSTSYFGKILALKEPDSAKLWVKWHEDAIPFTCAEPGGCAVPSADSVADLTAQSKGWSVKASINAKVATENGSPIVNSTTRASLSFGQSESPLPAKTLTSKSLLNTTCSQFYKCYVRTGTLMITVSGMCDSKPLIVCNRQYLPCEEFQDPRLDLCSQWSAFTEKYCNRGKTHVGKDECSISVAVTDENDEPISFQVFEQRLMSGDISIVPYGPGLLYEFINEVECDLPDCSSGAWMA